MASVGAIAVGDLAAWGLLVVPRGVPHATPTAAAVQSRLYSLSGNTFFISAKCLSWWKRAMS